jgi:hypothetical protein
VTRRIESSERAAGCGLVLLLLGLSMIGIGALAPDTWFSTVASSWWLERLLLLILGYTIGVLHLNQTEVRKSE